MRTREEAVSYCLKMPDVFEDYPFHDPNWTVIRMKSRKAFGGFLSGRAISG